MSTRGSVVTVIFLATVILFIPAAAGRSTPQDSASTLPPIRWPRFHTVVLDPFGSVISRKTGKASAYRQDLGNGVTLEMVRLKGSMFRMGSENDDGPESNDATPHPVRLSDFEIGKYEVTREQWREIARRSDLRVDRDLAEDPSRFKSAWELPVENIAWEDAVEFCSRLSRMTGAVWRLPTEAEWEFAARAGTEASFAFGPTLNPEIANYRSEAPFGLAPKGVSRGGTMPGGSLGAANRFGLFEMHGNVWEWCSDWYDPDYFDDCRRLGTVLDPKGPAKGSHRVLRGGGWPSIASRCRSALRMVHMPGSRLDDVGFRVVREGRR
jgi:formylglycine-generating enzyme required for sulfatase activity